MTSSDAISSTNSMATWIGFIDDSDIRFRSCPSRDDHQDGSFAPPLKPDGQAVVGLLTRVEASQGSGDDTAMNGLRLICAP